MVLCRNDSGRLNNRVNEWKLVYLPQNPVFEKLLTAAANSLDLDGVEGVNSTNEMIRTMLDRALVAGIEFQHSAVSTSSFGSMKFVRPSKLLNQK